ncbi:MAG: primosomal protein N' [Thermodesulfobacteriota bacterium]
MSSQNIKQNPEQSSPRYIEVAVAAGLGNTLTYLAPEGSPPQTLVGKRVLVPLSGRTATGYVLAEAGPPEGFDAKPVRKVLDETPLFPASQVAFFRFLASYYLYPIGIAIAEALPSAASAKARTVCSLTEPGRQALADEKLGPVEKQVLLALADASELPLPALTRRTGRKELHRVLSVLSRKGHVLLRETLEEDRVKEKTETWVAPAASESSAPARQKGRHQALALLNHLGPATRRELCARVPAAARWLPEMERAGEVKITLRPVMRDPFGEPIAPDLAPPVPTDEQAAALSRITTAAGNGFSVFLLNGVTGSGKTEIYLRAVAGILSRGLSALVLVPEIALISLMERRFRARFGEKVAVLHSGLSEGEHRDQWARIAAGNAPVVVGARSAVFAPLQNIGLVIVDEEHDESYKQENRLRYHARDMAVLRAKLSACPAVLSSGTPSLTSLYSARIGRFTELRLTRRVFNQPLPEISVVDLKDKKNAGIKEAMLSAPLLSEMQSALSRNEQVLLFLNRRGFAKLPVCASCGAALFCDHCDVSLTYHQALGLYLCHYCGFFRKPGTGCPFCGQSAIRHVGIGTEKVEQVVQKAFPDARTGRLDRDTVTAKGSLVAILDKLHKRETDILIGTQMVTKGHDFPGITLVGILCADLSLNFPDFRAAERTFQILCQVSGRAGRGQSPGKVVLQTFNPGHFCITAARESDLEGFYNRELKVRQALVYPPFSRLAQLRIQGEDPVATEKTAYAAAALCRELASALATDPVTVLGPARSPIARIAGQSRFQILCKGSPGKAFRTFLAALSDNLPKLPATRDTSLTLDVDPVSML